MDSMIIQELLIAVLSIGALVGGTACIRRFESDAKGTDNKGSNRKARRSAQVVAQGHSA